MRRHKMNRRRSEKMFSRTAGKIHPRNFTTMGNAQYRGGERMT